MSIISIFNGVFCKKENFLKDLIQKTGYNCLRDQDIISAASTISGISDRTIEKAFSARASVFNKFTHERERSIAYLKQALAELLVKDNLIIDGFAGHLIPKQVTHALRVCIIADNKYRLNVAKNEEKFNESGAARLIRKMDADCAQWVKRLHGIDDPWDAALYDIITPANQMTATEIVDLIMENLDKDILKANVHSFKALDDFKLSAAVEVALVNKIRDMGSAVAYDGESALELIQEDEPEVMILDLRMPGIDGFEVLKRVKKTNPDIEVIILTGHGTRTDRDFCMGLGAFAYLQKPVDIDELSETIKKANEQIRLKQKSKKV